MNEISWNYHDSLNGLCGKAKIGKIEVGGMFQNITGSLTGHCCFVINDSIVDDSSAKVEAWVAKAVEKALATGKTLEELSKEYRIRQLTFRRGEVAKQLEKMDAELAKLQNENTIHTT